MPAWASDSVGKVWSSSSPEGSPASPVFTTLTPSDRDLPRRRSSGYLSDGGPTPPPGLAGDGLLRYFLFRFVPNLFGTVFYLVWSQAILFGPALWISVWLWLIAIPLNTLKCLLHVLTTPASERLRKKRTVLISGGSTIQALHLARNFHSAGARVVAIEVQGCFGLARFSTAVDRFYSIPHPVGDKVDSYVAAVKRIVEEERAVYYIPVCSTSTAYYDALVKPHLELLGCTCFCPGLKEVCVLDDVFEVMRRCQSEGMATPLYYSVSSRDDVYSLYEQGTLTSGRHLIMSVGPLGCRDRSRLVLPPTVQQFRLDRHISHQRPWVIVRDYPGDHFITCTTVKDSCVVANVTCRVDVVKGTFSPVNHHEIDLWIKQFFGKLKFLRPLNGHISFRFVVSSASGSIVPLGCKVGVSLPYICHTSVHPRMIWKPCRHFNPRTWGPLVNYVGYYWMHQLVMETLKSLSVQSLTRFVSTLLNEQEALFVYWDPLPYFAYYHIQLPITNVFRLLGGYMVSSGGHGFRRVNK